MKKVMNMVFGGLEQKIFNLVLITVLLLIGAYTAVLVYQGNHITSLAEETRTKQQQSIGEISASTMHTTIEGAMTSSVALEAAIGDDLFRELKQQVAFLGRCVEKLYEEQSLIEEMTASVSGGAEASAEGEGGQDVSAGDEVNLRGVTTPDKASDGSTAVQLLTEEGVSLTDPDVAENAVLLSNLSDAMAALFDSTGLNSCFIGTPDGLFLIADDLPSLKLAEDGSVVSFPVRERFWYKGAAETGELYFTEIEKDAFSGRIGIVCAMPVYRDGELMAVVGADLFLEAMAEGTASMSHGDTHFSCIVNQNGHLIFSPRTGGQFAVQTADQSADLRESENEALAQFVKDALSGATDVRELELEGRTYYVAGAPLPTVGWAVVSVVDKAATEESTVRMLEEYDSLNEEARVSLAEGIRKSSVFIILLVLAISVLGCAAALTLAKKIVKPINSIANRVANLSGTNLQFMMTDDLKTGDEVEVLAESFAELSGRTVEYIHEITRITAEKERIGLELEMAQAIQESQLPSIFPPFPGRPEFDIYATMIPAKEVGGDFYDFFLIDSDHLCLVMADVSGKGVPAALFMMIAKILIKNRVQGGESPGEALSNVNMQLLEGNTTEMFVTTWLCILEISTGKGLVSNAGHEHPVLRRADGSYELVKYRHSPAVATLEGIPFKEHDFRLHPGDSLFVYTDGVAEAANPDNQLFGTDRLLKVLNREPDAEPEVVLKNVMDEITEFAAGAEQFDDITMLCLKYNGPVGEDRPVLVTET